jgi:hypothetical protein
MLPKEPRRPVGINIIAYKMAIKKDCHFEKGMGRTCRNNETRKEFFKNFNW